MASAKFTKKEIVVSKPVIAFDITDINNKKVTGEINCHAALKLIDVLLDAVVEADNQNINSYDIEEIENWKLIIKQKLAKLGFSK